MTARTAGFIGLAVYAVLMFAVLMVVAKVYGLAWELPLIPVEIIGGFAIGTLIGKAHAHWDAEPPPYAAKDLYGRRS